MPKYRTPNGPYRGASPGLSRKTPRQKSSGLTPVGRKTRRVTATATALAAATGTPTHNLHSLQGAQHEVQRQTKIERAQGILAKASGAKSYPGLDPSQARVLNTVLKTGRHSGASRQELLSAVETGLVESGLHNLGGGDADSAGWRQERASIYPNPTNLKASAGRYFQETHQAGPHATAGQLAADVQRPAAQYRGRYDQTQSQAKQLLHRYRQGQKASPKAAKARATLDKLHARPTKGRKSPQQTAKQFKGHYINPYKGLSPGEIDQGVDYGGSNDVKAIGNAVVKDTHGSFSGDWIAYTLTDGPRKGWTVYVAEHVAPKAGLKVGQKVQKGDVIGHMSGGIETGWAAKPGVPYQNSRTLTASQNPSYVAHRHDVMSGTPAASDPPEGRDFLQFLSGKPGLKLTGSGSSAGLSFSSSAGVGYFTNATGTTTAQAKQMTPKQRLISLHQALRRSQSALGAGSTSGVGGAARSSSPAPARRYRAPSRSAHIGLD